MKVKCTSHGWINCGAKFTEINCDWEEKSRAEGESGEGKGEEGGERESGRRNES